MPHDFVRLVDGVNANRTPALNEYAISYSQLIRYQYDNHGNILVQKLGGWEKYYPSPMPAKVRALWGWESTEANLFLAVAMENASGGFQSRLSVIAAGSLSNITPTQSSDDITPVVSSASGSSIITITDATTQNITQYNSVYIPTHIAIGGIVLFGLYPCDPDGHSAATTYTVQALDKLGNALAATATSSSPTLAQLATTSGNTVVTVTLANHGFNVGDVFPILVPTTVGGAYFFSNYPVQSVTSANAFTITASQTPTSTTTGYINNGFAQFIYSFGVGAVPPGSGYGRGGYGRGGYGRGVTTTPTVGSPISASDYFLENWGEILIGCPVPEAVVLTPTGASGTGLTGTLTFAESYTIPVNSTITVANVSPAAWNGTYVVTAASSGSVSFATAVVAAMTAAGTITLAMAPFSPIYRWDSEGGSPSATVIPQAPPVNAGFFIAMPQRQIVAWGSTFTGISDPLLLRWCDVNNFGVWIGQVTNQAGQFRLTKGSKIVGAIQGPQQGLIWTDIDLWSMQYVGPQFVYSFNEIGTGCGLIAPKAAGAIGGVVYWMGPSQFFTLSDGGVQPLPCPIWDIAFQDLDPDNIDKIRIAINSRFNEVAWYLPTLSSDGEVSMYVKYNYAIGLWDYAELGRTAWIDQSVLGPPIGASADDNDIYQHETSPDADGQPLLASFQTGYFVLNEGDQKVFIDQFWPDAKYGLYGGTQNATLSLSFYLADYPGDTPVQDGPYDITQTTEYISPRFRARLVSIAISSSDIGSFWRLGKMRYRWQPDGRF